MMTVAKAPVDPDDLARLADHAVALVPVHPGGTRVGLGSGVDLLGLETPVLCGHG